MRTWCTYLLLTTYFRKINTILPYLSTIDRDLIELLTVFLFYPLSNKNELHKLTEARTKNKHHRSFRRRVQKLIDLKLIEKEPYPLKFKKKSQLKRKEVYYKLSEEGIFVLFHHSDILIRPNLFFYDYLVRKGRFDGLNLGYVFTVYTKLIYKQKKDCKFFELFLSPWFSIEDIDRLDESIIPQLHGYLTDCCISVKNFLSSFPYGIWTFEDEAFDSKDDENSKRKVITFDFNNLKDTMNEKSNDPFLSFIKKIFRIENNDVYISQEHDSQFLLNFKEERKVYVVLNDQKQKLEIYDIEKGYISRFFLDCKSAKEIEIPINPLSYFISQFNFNNLFYRGVTFVLTENMSKEKLNLLFRNIQFKELASKIMEKVQNNYNLRNDNKDQI